MTDNLITPNRLMLGSTLLLLSALGFEHIGDLAPCALCYTQRLPHYAIVVIGVLGLAITLPQRAVQLSGLLLTLTAGIIAAYHSGVEQGMFEGPTTCTSNDISSLNVDDLLSQVMSAPIVRCDDIAWSLFGLSMASWHAVACTVLALGWAYTLMPPKRA